jgi:hypothetical protein
MRKMYDTVNTSVGQLPLDAQMVAGYVDGFYRWSAADWARFPSAVHVPIAVHPSTNGGTVLDVEKGDATPEQAPGWVTMRRAEGVDPSVYCSHSPWKTVREQFLAQGVAEPHYWVAGYPDGGPVLFPGAVAHQYADVGPHGENYDTSVVADFWPGVDNPGAPLPVPPTATAGAHDMDVYWTNDAARKTPGGAWGTLIMQGSTVLMDCTGAENVLGFPADYVYVHDLQSDAVKATMNPILVGSAAFDKLRAGPTITVSPAAVTFPPYVLTGTAKPVSA